MASNDNMSLLAVGNADTIIGWDNDNSVFMVAFDPNPSVPGCSWVGQPEGTGNFCYDPNVETSTTRLVELSIYLS